MKEIVDFIKGFDYHTIIIVGVAFWLLNSNINNNITPRLDAMEKDLTVIKTVLVMKQIIPSELCKKESDAK